MAAMEGPGIGLAQLAVQQQLRTAYGIKITNRTAKGKVARSSGAASEAGAGKVFGIALQQLPHQVVSEHGNIPCFLVEACKYLEEHIQTEGLFRKSGSVVRLKTLKSKLDKGEDCLSNALPCDVAGLLKQFFRDLPEPILPNDLQKALIKAQKLDKEERMSATLLISCLMNDRLIDTLRYFFLFLKKVSLSSAENKMDSSNLAVIFAPNLLQSSETEKMSVHTEKKLRLQAGVLQILIDHAELIGKIPKPILEKIPAIVDPVSTPLLQGYEESECEMPSEHSKRKRRNIGVFSAMTPVTVTPGFKRKYPADYYQGFSSKKRRSVRSNMDLEILPHSLFSFSSTPGSAQSINSPSALLEASQSSPSTSVTYEKYLLSRGTRRSKRIANKKVQRAESGKTGCFSPKISHKEVVRRSLRLKFILGRSNREGTVMEHSDNNRSENIGRRLANQQDIENEVETMKTVALLSPCVDFRNISKSEENLQLLRHHTEANYRLSWTGSSTTETQAARTLLKACPETEISSDPAFTSRRHLEIPLNPVSTDASNEYCSNKHTSFCEDETNLTANMLLKIRKAFSESGSNFHDFFETQPSKSNVMKFKNLEPKLKKALSKATAQKVNVNQESLFESPANKSGAIDKFLTSTDQINTADEFFFQTNKTGNPVCDSNQSDGEEDGQLTASPVIQLSSINTIQEILDSKFIPEENTQEKESKYCNLKKDFSDGGDKNNQFPQVKSKRSPSGKVADHIHWFNNLSLNEICSATETKPVLTFQRTPVRQSVRRINSLLEAGKQAVSCKKAGDGCTSLAKSLSYETALSCIGSVANTSLLSKLKCKKEHDQLALSSKSFSQLTYLSNQSISPDTTIKEKRINNNSKSVLEDLTNHKASKTLVKTNTTLNASVVPPDKCVLRKMAGNQLCYKGSPKNPIPKAKLLPTVKPVDL